MNLYDVWMIDCWIRDTRKGVRTVLLEQATKRDIVSPINKKKEVLDIDLIHMMMFKCQDVNDLEEH